MAAIKFGVSPRPVDAVYDRRICWRRQILTKTRNSPNSPNIIARQNLLIYSMREENEVSIDIAFTFTFTFYLTFYLHLNQDNYATVIIDFLLLLLI